MIAIPILMVLLGVLVWYTAKCIKQISTISMEGSSVPAQAIITVWGKAERAVGQGLYWFWYPRDKIGLLIPTITYHLKFKEFLVHTKNRSEEEATKPVKVGVTIHVTLPRVGQRYEVEKNKVPCIWENCVERDIREETGEDENAEDVEKAIISGELLLVHHLYPSIAPDKLFNSDMMAAFLKDAIMDGVRARMVDRTYTECREDKTEIEEEIREYLLTDSANLFVKCGIPLENLDVSITSLESTEDIEHSLYAEEIAEIEGRASQKEIAALIQARVDPQIAAMLVKGIGGKGSSINFEAMAHMGIALKFMGIQSPYQESLSTDSIGRVNAILDEMSVEEAVTMKEVLRTVGINL